jgi:hypothetical protein
MTSTANVALAAYYLELPGTLQYELREFKTKLNNHEPIPDIALLFGTIIQENIISKRIQDARTIRHVRDMLIICAEHSIGCMMMLMLPQFIIG